MRTQDMHRKGEDSLWTMKDAEKNRKQEQMEGERGRNERERERSKKERPKKSTKTWIFCGCTDATYSSYSFFMRKGLGIINTWCIGCARLSLSNVFQETFSLFTNCTQYGKYFKNCESSQLLIMIYTSVSQTETYEGTAGLWADNQLNHENVIK